MESPSPLWYLFILAMLALSAFFSASETAISTANRLRLKKAADEGDAKARSAIKLAENYNKTLFTILVGNNLVNIASSAVATMLATAMLGAKGALAATAVITVLVLTFGEILPKSYGGDNSEKVSLAIASPLSFIVWLFTPLTWFFMKLKSSISKPKDPAPTVTEEELIYMLESIEEEGVIEEQERDLVQSALEFDEVSIKEILTPRVNVVALDINDSDAEIREALLIEGYSRVPVYEGSIDNIIGLLFARDYIKCIIAGTAPDLRSMLVEPLFVHRTMKLSQLFSVFKINKANIAVVTDDYGGTLGIVTMEDVLEELVGDLWDEDDDAPDGLVRIGEDIWEVLGSYDLRDLLDELDAEKYALDTEYTTVNGWAGHIFEHIPAPGETAVHHDLILTVQEMDGRRIKRLRIERTTPETEESGGEKQMHNQNDKSEGKR